MQFFKTTLIGGIVFLIPFAFVAIALGKAFQLMRTIAEPLAAWSSIDTVGGVALASIVAWIGLVGLCFVAGLVAKSPAAVRLMRRLDSGFLTSLPGYGVVKGMVESVAGNESTQTLKPVLARFDDSSQIALEVDRDSAGRVVVYLPGAPDPWSGTVVLMTPDRVQTLDAPLNAVMKSMRVLGRNAGTLVPPPSGAPPDR